MQMRVQVRDETGRLPQLDSLTSITGTGRIHRRRQRLGGRSSRSCPRSRTLDATTMADAMQPTIERGRTTYRRLTWPRTPSAGAVLVPINGEPVRLAVPPSFEIVTDSGLTALPSVL
jgi:hypothetical protein